MNLFFFFPFVLIGYAALHVYTIFILRRAAPALRPWAAWMAVIALALFAGPFITRFLGNRGFVRLAHLAGLVGYTWIAVIFWFSMLSLGFDAWNLLIRLGSLFAPALARVHVLPKRAAQASGALVLAAMLWGLLEANALKVETIVIPVSSWPAGEQVTLLQVSDVHLGIGRGGRAWRYLLRAINDLQPDFVVSTGDLTDAPAAHVRGRAEALRHRRPYGGVYGVLGNHDFYTRLNESLPFHEAAGIQLLRGALVQATPGLWFAGVDDPAGSYTRQPYFTDEGRLAAARPPDEFVVLLKHQPLVSSSAGVWFDLQLSGHTHGGQLFPFEQILRLLYPRRRGLHEIAPGKYLYVNRGAGTWGPPLRLFARPEITRIVLEGRRK